MDELAPSDNTIVDRVHMLFEKHSVGPGSLLNILNDLQDEYRYIPDEALVELSAIGPWTYDKLLQFVEFFNDFSLVPVGEHVISVCDGTACHAAGSVDVIKALEDHLDIKCGCTSDDRKWTLRKVHCVGACSLAPVVNVDSDSYGKVRISKLSEIAPKRVQIDE